MENVVDEKFVLDVKNYQFLYSHPTYIHRRGQGGLGAILPKIFRTYSHFVLWEVVFQTK